MKKKIAILGAGAYGIALAIILCKFHEVRLWVRSKREAKKISKKRESKYLKGKKLPECVFISSDLGEVIQEADLAIFAIPSFGLRGAVKKVSKIIKNWPIWPILLTVSKGMEKKTLKLPVEVIEDVFGRIGIPTAHITAHMSGAGFAAQIADEKKQITEVLASNNHRIAEEIKQILETPKFQIILDEDLVGIQLGGALKNILAIAVAMVDQASGDQKTVSKILSLAVKELIRVGIALGGDETTLKGASIDDFVLTASDLSRNYQVGKRILTFGLPKIKEEIKRKKITCEGLESAEAMYQICRERGIKAPILAEVYKVISQKETPQKAAENLINLVKKGAYATR